MTNTSKWFIAVPFTFILAIIIPALITGNWIWFLKDWGDSAYIFLTIGMWIAATAFVDVSKPRTSMDIANFMIPAGLILSVPISVFDRVYGIAYHLSDGIKWFAVVIGGGAIAIGIYARISLGEYYSPRGKVQAVGRLIRTGPYRWIRHPMYLAAIAWGIGWPLFVRSILGVLVNSLFLLPAIKIRIREEENELIKSFGDEYENYRKETWRLIPFIY